VVHHGAGGQLHVLSRPVEPRRVRGFMNRLSRTRFVTRRQSTNDSQSGPLQMAITIHETGWETAVSMLVSSPMVRSDALNRYRCVTVYAFVCQTSDSYTRFLHHHRASHHDTAHAYRAGHAHECQAGKRSLSQGDRHNSPKQRYQCTCRERAQRDVEQSERPQ